MNSLKITLIGLMIKKRQQFIITNSNKKQKHIDTLSKIVNNIILKIKEINNKIIKIKNVQNITKIKIKLMKKK